MEQCVARLDVAMFNAILRESADDIPTDRVSDTISNPKVLPIPPALDSQDDLKDGKETVNNFPYIAAPVVYSPPPATIIASIIGEIGGESQLRRSRSVVRKSYTSDDELDELNSPLSSIFIGSSSSPVSTKPNWKMKDSSNESAVRYELLRDVWINSEGPCRNQILPSSCNISLMSL